MPTAPTLPGDASAPPRLPDAPLAVTPYHRSSAPLVAVAGAVAFSGKAIIVKLAYRHGVDAITLITLRMVVALPFFLAMVWWAGRGKPPLAWRDKRAAAALGFLGYYLASLLDFLGLQHISAGLERLILYLSPAVVLVLSWALLGRRATVRQGLAMALGYAGLLLVFGHELHLEGPQVLLGTALVLGSTLSYALYLIYSGEVVRRIGSLRLTGWASSVACGLCLAQYGLLRLPELPELLGMPALLAPVGRWAALSSLTTLTAPVWWLSLLNGTVCTVLPVWLVMRAIELIGPARTAQYGMVGPVSTIVLGVLILDEPFTAWVAAGSLAVLAGVMLLAAAR